MIITIECEELKKMKSKEGYPLNKIIYIKYKEKENINKALFEMKAQEKIAEVTTI